MIFSRSARLYIRLLALSLVLLILVLPLSACSDGTGATVRYDISASVGSLDPQYAYSEDAKLIVRNAFEGLFARNADGSVVPAAAQSYTLSEDRLTATITLREGLVWSGGPDEEKIPLTAADFAFALRRLFTADFPSAFAVDFSCLSNAGAILRGDLPPSALGVRAADARTLVLTLEYPEEDLPDLLTSTAAMPCNEAYFESMRGRYGLDDDTMLYNGPFRIQFWERGDYVQLRRNEQYRDPAAVAPERLIFHITPAAEHFARFADGKTDAAVLSFEEWDGLADKKRRTAQPFEDTVWTLVFNEKDAFLSIPDARRALAAAIDHRQFAPHLGYDLVDTTVFLPPVLRLGGKSYRKLAGFDGPDLFDPDKAAAGFSSAVAQSGGRAPRSLTLLVPENDVHPLTAGALQKAWIGTLALAANVVLLPQGELTARVEAGDYQAAIVPLRPDLQTPGGMLADFRSTSAQNIAAYQSGAFDALLDRAAAVHNAQGKLEAYRAAENLLLTDAVLVPLYFQTHYYVMGPGVRGIRFSPFAGETAFWGALKG